MPILSRETTGVLLVLFATFLFALSDLLTKDLTMRLAVPLVVLVRYGVNAVLLAAVFLPRHGTGLWRVRRPALVALRGLCLAAASLTMGLALRVMPLGETVAIIYLAPILVVLLAGPLLGERVPLSGWVGALIGFAGVVMIARPGAGLDPWGVALALVNVLFGAGYHLLSRILSRTETAMAMTFHTALAGVAVFGLLVIWGYDGARSGPLPDLRDLGLMLILGALATGGHMAFTLASARAPASLLAPVNYVHLVWAGLLGLVVLGHMPDPISLAGMLAVAAAGALAAVRARRPG